MDVEREMKAIQSIVTTLAELEADAQQRVLDYTLKVVGYEPSSTTPLISDQTNVERAAAEGETKDIRSFREAKNPRNAYEMAALVAYYVTELAPVGARKETITPADIEKYFKQAGYPLPSRVRDALKTSPGFLEKTAPGEFRLTPVGHNLVVHKLPHGDR